MAKFLLRKYLWIGQKKMSEWVIYIVIFSFGNVQNRFFLLIIFYVFFWTFIYLNIMKNGRKKHLYIYEFSWKFHQMRFPFLMRKKLIWLWLNYEWFTGKIYWIFQIWNVIEVCSQMCTHLMEMMFNDSGTMKHQNFNIEYIKQATPIT